MKFNLGSKSNTTHQVCFYYKKAKSKNLQFCSCSDPDSKQEIENLFKAEKINGAFGETLFFRNSSAGNALFVGLGDGSLTPEKIRELTGKIYKKLKAEKVDNVRISLEAIPHRDKSQVIGAMTEAFIMSSYKFDTFKMPPTKKNHRNGSSFYCKEPQRFSQEGHG